MEEEDDNPGEGAKVVSSFAGGSVLPVLNQTFAVTMKIGEVSPRLRRIRSCMQTVESSAHSSIMIHACIDRLE
jgi:hypothetical protein